MQFLSLFSFQNATGYRLDSINFFLYSAKLHILFRFCSKRGVNRISVLLSKEKVLVQDPHFPRFSICNICFYVVYSLCFTEVCCKLIVHVYQESWHIEVRSFFVLDLKFFAFFCCHQTVHLLSVSRASRTFMDMSSQESDFCIAYFPKLCPAASILCRQFLSGISSGYTKAFLPQGTNLIFCGLQLLITIWVDIVYILSVLQQFP